MMFIIHIWQYWWTEKDPYPSLKTIAAKMDVTRRQVRNYTQSLKAKGLLQVRERILPGLGQVTSEYDFEPLLKAVLKLDRDAHVSPVSDEHPETTPLTTLTEGGMTDLTEAPLTRVSEEEYKEQ